MSSDRESDDVAFVKETVASLATRRLLLPALVLAVLLAAGKVLLLLALPTARNPLHPLYLLAFVMTVLATIILVVAILRMLNRSARPLLQPDSSLLLYAFAFILISSIGSAAGGLVGGANDHPSGLAAISLSIAVQAPFAPWLAAIAVERSLAWQPGPWLRDCRAWLPSLLFWGLLILLPLRHLQLMLNWKYLVGGTDWFWPASLVEGVLGAVIELIALALASTAYRRVARS